MPALEPPTVGAQLIDRTGMLSKLWRPWFQQLYRMIGWEPFPVASYTVATVPDATAYESHLIYVSNEAGGATLAFSDGVSWRRVQDRVVIS